MKHENLNIIITVDVDSNRSNPVLVRTLNSVQHDRSRQPDTDPTPQEVANGLVNGLVAMILHLEASGIEKKGEAMKTAVGLLSQAYTDSTLTSIKTEGDSSGNITKRTNSNEQ